MDERLWRRFYCSCFQDENQHIVESESYRKAKETMDDLRQRLIDTCTDSELSCLLDAYEDSLFNLLDAYRYADFKFQFINGIRLGLSLQDEETVPSILSEVQGLLGE